MSRPIDQILGAALSELKDREQKLATVHEQTGRELADVRKAMKRLGGGMTAAPRARPQANGNGEAAMDADEKRERVLAALGEEPLSVADLAAAAGVSARGLHFALAALKDKRQAAEPEPGLWMAT